MERNINNKDFEQFVKQNADQYRMYPSEKVWKGVYSALHTRRTWYGVGFALLILTAVAVTWVMVSSPATKQLANNNAVDNKQHQTQTTPVQKISGNQPLGPTIRNNNLPGPFIAQAAPKQPVITPGPLEDQFSNMKLQSVPVLNNHVTVATTDNPNDLYKTEALSRIPVNVNIKDQATDNEYDLSTLNKGLSSGNTITKTTPRKNVYPMTIESVLNSYKKVALKSKKMNWQLSFTPTISYRKLTENKSFLRNTSAASGTSSYAYLYNVNSVVTHKPDMGFELGVNTTYPLTKNLKILGGLEFNINRYGIKAFSYPSEVATIELNSGGYHPDSVATWTNYRNFNGYNSNWLQNFYFSVSVPVGVEFKLSSNSNTQFGIAATVQPTYVIGDRAYLISTDYKNYVEVPWLTRRWNVNTGFETFVTYSTGKLKWQVGPQVRYQLLSSFKNKYPVKENLFDFGLKVGIMLNK